MRATEGGVCTNYLRTLTVEASRASSKGSHSYSLGLGSYARIFSPRIKKSSEAMYEFISRDILAERL